MDHTDRFGSQPKIDFDMQIPIKNLFFGKPKSEIIRKVNLFRGGEFSKGPLWILKSSFMSCRTLRGFCLGKLRFLENVDIPVFKKITFLEIL